MIEYNEYNEKTPSEKKIRTLKGYLIAMSILASVGVVFGATGLGLGIYSATKAPSNPTIAIGTSGTILGASSDMMYSTERLESDLAWEQVAENVIPSVVTITAYNEITPVYSSFFSNSTQTAMSQGSGVIATKDGYIITNAHVVGGATKIAVKTYDGRVFESKIVGTDSATDLALIKIEAEKLVAAKFGSSANLRVAESVMTIGSPGGEAFQNSVSRGCVSALNRDIITSNAVYLNAIQTDAVINPGNSGGALVNSNGQVVGINSSKLVNTSYEGMGFAIPIDDALNVINDLREYGYVRNRGILGVSGQYIDSVTASWNRLTSAGYYVGRIDTELAQISGIKIGDIITKIDDSTITSSSVISAVLQKKKAGESVNLVVRRGNEDIDIKLTLSEKQSESVNS